MSFGGSAAVSTNSRQGMAAAAVGTTNAYGSLLACIIIITGRAAGSSMPVVPKTLVRLGPVAFQSIGLPLGSYQLTSGSIPGFGALPVRNEPRGRWAAGAGRR